MGLPGSGKSTLAKQLVAELSAKKYSCININADDVRTLFNDWDFSLQGRLNQAQRMKDLADGYGPSYVICDFVAPLQEAREIFDADFTVWVDTITESRFLDTDMIFEKPQQYDVIVKEKDAKKWAKLIAHSLIAKD